MNLLAIAEKAAAVGMGIAGNVKVQATVKSGPTNTLDTTTDTTSTAWAFTETVQALPYDNRDEAPQDPEFRTRTFLVERATLSTGHQAALDTNTMVEAEGHEWNVWKVAIDPGLATAILSARRKG